VVRGNRRGQARFPSGDVDSRTTCSPGSTVWSPTADTMSDAKIAVSMPPPRPAGRARKRADRALKEPDYVASQGGGSLCGGVSEDRAARCRGRPSVRSPGYERTCAGRRPHAALVRCDGRDRGLRVHDRADAWGAARRGARLAGGGSSTGAVHRVFRTSCPAATRAATATGPGYGRDEFSAATVGVWEWRPRRTRPGQWFIMLAAPSTAVIRRWRVVRGLRDVSRFGPRYGRGVRVYRGRTHPAAQSRSRRVPRLDGAPMRCERSPNLAPHLRFDRRKAWPPGSN
jgi:hypothetical protein